MKRIIAGLTLVLALGACESEPTYTPSGDDPYIMDPAGDTCDGYVTEQGGEQICVPE